MSHVSVSSRGTPMMVLRHARNVCTVHSISVAPPYSAVTTVRTSHLQPPSSMIVSLYGSTSSIVVLVVHGMPW